ncbi:MAG: ABC transporter permease [Candidatus Saccharicenans sp.]
MIRFIIKGVLRDRSRSLFPVLIVAAGAMLTVFFYSYMQGGKNNFIDTSARYQTGHLKVMTRAYAAEADLLPNDLAITELSQELARLRTEYPELLWLPRIRFFGLLDIPDEAGQTRAQGPLSGLAVELFQDERDERNEHEEPTPVHDEKDERNSSAINSALIISEKAADGDKKPAGSKDSASPDFPSRPSPTNPQQNQAQAGKTEKSKGGQRPGAKPSPEAAVERPPELEILNLEKGLLSGRLPQRPGEILVPSELARSLQIKPGDRATIISSTTTGALAIADFTVAGIIRFGITPLDKGLVIADLADIQRLLDMEDAAGEIFGFFPDFLYDRVKAARMVSDFNQKTGAGSSEDDDFQPLMLTLGQQGGLADMIAIYDTYAYVLVAVFVAVMSIVLWNAGLMGSLRRYGEIGLRLAMGETRRHLYFSLLGESLIIGALGSLLGTALGLAIAYYLQTHGLNAEAFTKSSEMMMTNVIKAQVTWVSYVIGFIPGLLATLLGTAIAGLGVFRRRTASLMKEFEA